MLELDFTAANILLQLANIDEWTVDQIHERLGKPLTQDLHRVVGVDDLSGPRYTISTIDMVSQISPSPKTDSTQLADSVCFFRSWWIHNGSQIRS